MIKKNSRPSKKNAHPLDSKTKFGVGVGGNPKLNKPKVKKRNKRNKI